MPSSLTVFLLCAGYGNRLRPLTSRIPKPLIPFQGKTALRINWEKICALNPDRIICNTHHLPELVEKEAKALSIEVIHEPEILGTGGCLGKARNILEQTDLFMVHNADIMHDINLQSLLDLASQSPDLGILAGIDRHAVNTLVLNAKGKLAGVGNDGTLTFSGIGVYKKSFLEYCQNKVAHITEFWNDALKAGEQIQIRDFPESAWFDFGDPQGLWEAARWYIDLTGEYGYNYNTDSDSYPCVSNEANLPDLPERLRNVLIYESPDESMKAGMKNCVVGKDFRWEITG
jgi:mannose-1-phosphate guanylyltransferase